MDKNLNLDLFGQAFFIRGDPHVLSRAHCCTANRENRQKLRGTERKAKKIVKRNKEMLRETWRNRGKI